ncbi:MAG TPA: hypothetical protein VNK26_07380 [Pyrinomonadaceae bacterium]|jgi:hypothetical protein|nr:hypothetical protein [Pyrinomonadaceae bacterium]
MSVTLLDLGNDSMEFTASVWRWKAVLEVIKSLAILSDNKVQMMSYNALGTKISAEEAHLIGEKIKETILPRLAPNKRIFADLSITDLPDDGTFYKNENEQWKNYSVNYQWLESFVDFCLRSNGFQIY